MDIKNTDLRLNPNITSPNDALLNAFDDIRKLRFLALEIGINIVPEQ